MWVAIPHHQGRVSPVFDVASRLTLMQVKGRRELERREVILFETRPDGIARNLAELGVDVLICGAISQLLERLLHRDGVRVVAQVCGEVEAVLKAFLGRTLNAPEFRLPGCYRQPRDLNLRQPRLHRQSARAGPGRQAASRCEPVRGHAGAGGIAQ
jgi:predicted Fe-Mo cluster-binding NifX family protein